MKTYTLPRLHHACSNDDLRPALNHILVNKKHVVASNAHVLVMHETGRIFNDDFINAMPEEFFIHRSIWEKIYNNHLTILFEKEMIKVVYEKYVVFYPVKINTGFVYPNYEAVIPINPESTDKIGISAYMLKKLCSAMFYGYEEKDFIMKFYGEFKGIIVTPMDESIKCTELLMPKAIY